MTTIQLIYTYLIAVPVFFFIDMLWLGVIAQSFYQSKLGHLLGPINWSAAIAFYLIYIVGILIFAVVPALAVGSITKALLYGALFGFFTYATYDITNFATLKDWPFLVVIVDILWGTVLGACVATVTYYLAQNFVF